MDKYNQDKHTAQTIKQLKKLIDNGNIDKAVVYLKIENEKCKLNNGVDASKAFMTDVMMSIKLGF